MALLVFGVNHKTATLAERESFALTPGQLEQALLSIQKTVSVSELVILSTCNRSEWIIVTTEPQSSVIKQWLHEHQGIPAKLIEKVSYEYWGEAAIRHLMEVASGLDSMVLGEPQILGQIKEAYFKAEQQGTVGIQLSRIFQRVFAVAKQVRTDTGINASPVSIAYAAVSLAKHIFSQLEGVGVLLVGAGETIELVARHLKEQKIGQIWVANRTLERAEHLAQLFSGQAITLNQIPEILSRVEIVVSSTASPLPLLGKGMVEAALRRRKHRPIFMIDLAVPRDIEAEVAELEEIYLYTLDDLQASVAANQQQREQEAIAARTLVDAAVINFTRQLSALSAVSILRTYRQKTEKIREQELQKAMSALQRGMPAEEVLARMSRAIVNKMMHHPSVELREAAAQQREDWLAWSHRLLGLTAEQEEMPPNLIQLLPSQSSTLPHSDSSTDSSQDQSSFL